VAGSSIGETINIKNNSSSPPDFHFFQYSHFILGSMAAGGPVESEPAIRPGD
jgi:hypothetical protein